jgi:hypothetical protein
VAVEAGLTCGAEAAPHRATGLARYAHRRPVAVHHQHGLDLVAAIDRRQELDRVAVARHRFGEWGQLGRQPSFDVLAQGAGQVRHR